MEHYSVLKRNELANDGKSWRKLKCILIIQKGQLKRLNSVLVQLYDVLKVQRKQKDQQMQRKREEEEVGW